MRRVNESVRAVLAEAIGELKDPRIGFITVTGVDTSTDLRQATVFVSVLAPSASASGHSPGWRPLPASSRAASQASCG